MGILIIAEHDNKKLSPSLLPTITAARELTEDITILVAGYQCDCVADAASKIDGVTRVKLADAAHYKYGLVEELTPLIISQVSEEVNYILAPATTFGKNLMPRVAALLDVAQISDVVKINSPDTFVRPIYAGNILATVQSQDSIKVITIRTTAFAPVNTQSGTAQIETIAATPIVGLSEFINCEFNTSDRPDLMTARVVISGGRGLATAENFKLLEDIADKLAK